MSLSKPLTRSEKSNSQAHEALGVSEFAGTVVFVEEGARNPASNFDMPPQAIVKKVKPSEAAASGVKELKLTVKGKVVFKPVKPLKVAAVRAGIAAA